MKTQVGGGGGLPAISFLENPRDKSLQVLNNSECINKWAFRHWQKRIWRKNIPLQPKLKLHIFCFRCFHIISTNSKFVLMYYVMNIWDNESKKERKKERKKGRKEERKKERKFIWKDKNKTSNKNLINLQKDYPIGTKNELQQLF